MSITGLDARYLQVNDTFARMLGRSVAELHGPAGGGHLAPRRRRRRPRPDPRPHRQPRRDRRAREALRPPRRLDRPRQPERLGRGGPRRRDAVPHRADGRHHPAARRRARAGGERAPFPHARDGVARGHLLGHVRRPPHLRQRPTRPDLRHRGRRGRRAALARPRRARQPRGARRDGRGRRRRRRPDVDGRPARPPTAGARWVRLNLAAIPADGPGGAGTFVGTIDDVTAEVEAARELAAREAEYRVLADHSGDCLSRHDLEGRYLYVSPASEAYSATARRSSSGRTAAELGFIHPEDVGDVGALKPEVVEGDRHDRDRGLARPAARRLRALARDRRPLHPRRRRRPYQVVAVTRDVSERKDAETRLAHQALHDALTGLPNRDAVPRPPRAGAASARSATTAASRCCSSTSTASSSSTTRFGHAAGDRLLCDVAERLRRALRPADTIARFGGDEFTVLCEDLDGEAGARAVAAAHRRRCSRSRSSSRTARRSCRRASASRSRATARAPEDLIRDADAAMYRAKDGGRARVEVFDEAMRARRPRARRDRERAAPRDRARRAVHPLPAGRRPRRRAHRGASRRSSAGSTPSAGSSRRATSSRSPRRPGLIVPIGNWVLREACRTLRRWEDDLGVDWVQCSVNLSVRHLQQPDLVATVRAALAEHGLPAERLVLEITESAVMENGSGTVETLEALQGARRPPRARRLRHRLLVARAPAPLPARRPEDRPLLHRRPRRRPPGRVDRRRDRLARAGARPRHGRRGHRGRRPAAPARARSAARSARASSSRAPQPPADVRRRAARRARAQPRGATARSPAASGPRAS